MDPGEEQIAQISTQQK
jgi:hypothetical protein